MNDLEKAFEKIKLEWERQKNLFPVLSNDGWMDDVIGEAEQVLLKTVEKLQKVKSLCEELAGHRLMQIAQGPRRILSILK